MCVTLSEEGKEGWNFALAFNAVASSEKKIRRLKNVVSKFLVSVLHPFIKLHLQLEEKTFPVGIFAARREKDFNLFGP